MQRYGEILKVQNILEKNISKFDILDKYQDFMPG